MGDGLVRTARAFPGVTVSEGRRARGLFGVLAARLGAARGGEEPEEESRQERRDDGERDDAVRLFRELLEMAPDHTDAYAELVRLRARDQDVRWLRQALRSERDTRR